MGWNELTVAAFAVLGAGIAMIGGDLVRHRAGLQQVRGPGRRPPAKPRVK